MDLDFIGEQRIAYCEDSDHHKHQENISRKVEDYYGRKCRNNFTNGQTEFKESRIKQGKGPTSLSSSIKSQAHDRHVNQTFADFGHDVKNDHRNRAYGQKSGQPSQRVKK